MKLYRIYTENKNLRRVKKILNKYLDAYTLIKGTGVWKGKREKALIIEVIYESLFANIQPICYEIKRLNGQESILSVEEEIKAEFI